MKKIERTNKKNVGQNVYDNIRKTCAAMQKSEAHSKSYTFFDLFRMPQLRNNTIILIIIWMIIALVRLISKSLFHKPLHETFPLLTVIWRPRS